METDSCFDVIYVKLLDEGTEVYRPANARVVSPGVAEIICPEDYDPEDEKWEFKPGSVVNISKKQLTDAEVFVAMSLARRG